MTAELVLQGNTSVKVPGPGNLYFVADPPARAEAQANTFGLPYTGDGQHFVFAHYMLAFVNFGSPGDGGGDVFSYALDCRAAQAAGFDAFAVNLGSYAAPYDSRLAKLFQAANLTGFKLFLSLDQSGNMGTDQILPMVESCAGDPAYFRYQGRPLLSTFGGEGAYAERRDFWGNQILGALRAKGINPYFVPLFGNRHADGSGSTDSPADIAETTAGLFTGVADGRFFADVQQCPLSPAWAVNQANYLAANKAAGLTQMSSVSPQYWQGGVPANGRFYVEGYGFEGIHATWQAARAGGVLLMQVFTWNDWNETAYVLTLPPGGLGPSLAVSQDARFYLPRGGLLDFMAYEAQWFKMNAQPAAATDHLFVCQRTNMRSMTCADPLGPVTNIASLDGTVPDEAFVAVLATGACSLVYTCYPNATQTFPLVQGLNFVRVGFGYGVQQYSLMRGGKTVLAMSGPTVGGGSQTGTYNYGYWSGHVHN